MVFWWVASLLPMRIARIDIAHMGPFEEASLTIPTPQGEGELVLFEGPNGSGKTTLLEAICGTLAALTGHHQGVITKKFSNRMRKGSNLEITWHGLSDDGTPWKAHPVHSGSFQSTFQQDEFSRFSVSRKLLEYRPDSGAKLPIAMFSYHGAHNTPNLNSQGPKSLNISPVQGALDIEQEGVFSQHIGQILTNIESERTKAIVYAKERSMPEMEERAKALKQSLQRMSAALSQMIGWHVEFQFDLQRQAPTVLFDGQPIAIGLLGEGLRRTFSWMIDLLARLESTQWEDATRSPFDQEFLLFLDEVDQSLHPTMQMRLMPTLRKLFSRARIYATTHSPFVVASVEEGYVFPIRPDPKTHRVNGEIEPQHLQGGRSLEAVVTDVFDAPATFIDEKTRHELEAHKNQVDALRAGKDISWDEFLTRRRVLHALGEEVGTVVAMREVPIRKRIEEKLREAGE